MIEIMDIDYRLEYHRKIILELLNEYASEVIGNGKSLSDYTRDHLVNELEKRTQIHVILGFIDNKPVGMIIGIEGFSTFSSKPLINIHDLFVKKKYRGNGISKMLIAKIENIAKNLGCCKITLEVLENNHVGMNLYKKMGFSHYVLDPIYGKALFLEKKLE